MTSAHTTLAVVSIPLALLGCSPQPPCAWGFFISTTVACEAGQGSLTRPTNQGILGFPPPSPPPKAPAHD